MASSKVSTRSIALLAGFIYVLAFSPFEFSLLAFLSLASLFWLWLQTTTTKEAFILGWLFGFGQFGAGVSWMYTSLTTFGGMPTLLACLAVLILVMGLAVFPAMVGLIQQLFCHSHTGIRTVFIIAPAWVSFEWLREWLFTGLPWLAAGYSQTENFLGAWAPVGGIYILSLIVVLIACCVLLVLTAHKRMAATLAFALIVLTIAVNLQEWTAPEQQSLSVKLVQGNVSIWDKWNLKKSGQILADYLTLSEQGQSTDLIIWPEAAVPLLMQQLPAGFIKKLFEKQSLNENSYIMFGVIEKDPVSGSVYNSVASTEKDGSFSFYRKVHLVPFGEFLPFKFFLHWLLDYLHIPMSDFSAFDRSQKLIDVKGVKIGVSICYEDAFANVIRASLPQAGLLVNVSEDAWFGNSLAPHQRLQMAQMRAMENGRTLVRVSNNGLSAVINHKGEVMAIAPQFQTFVFDAQVEIRRGATPFSILGHKPVLSLIGFLFLCALIYKFTGLKQENGGQS